MGRVGCLRQPTLPLSIRINTGSLYRNVSILNYKRDKDNVSYWSCCVSFPPIMTGYVADLRWKSGARDWKVRSTKVDTGDFKHELLNRLRSTMAVNVLICRVIYRALKHFASSKYKKINSATGSIRVYQGKNHLQRAVSWRFYAFNHPQYVKLIPNEDNRLHEYDPQKVSSKQIFLQVATKALSITTTKAPWWRHVWSAKTCWRTDDVWRIHLLQVKLLLQGCW